MVHRHELALATERPNVTPEQDKESITVSIITTIPPLFILILFPLPLFHACMLPLLSSFSLEEVENFALNLSGHLLGHIVTAIVRLSRRIYAHILP